MVIDSKFGVPLLTSTLEYIWTWPKSKLSIELIDQIVDYVEKITIYRFQSLPRSAFANYRSKLPPSIIFFRPRRIKTWSSAKTILQTLIIISFKFFCLALHRLFGSIVTYLLQLIRSILPRYSWLFRITTKILIKQPDFLCIG